MKDGRQVSVATIRWKLPDFIEIGVSTREEFRQHGHGLLAVAAATEWVLARGAVAHYAVKPDNLPSCRIPRRLGYTVAWQEVTGRAQWYEMGPIVWTARRKQDR
jgi:RimJ/RimL family protein N-acetyltransferase